MCAYMYICLYIPNDDEDLLIGPYSTHFFLRLKQGEI